MLGSNTMVGEEERAVTMALRARALERGAGVLFDANLRIARWRDPSSRSGSAALPVRARCS